MAKTLESVAVVERTGKKRKGYGPRSPLVKAIYEALADRRKWVKRDELTKKVESLIPKKKALEVYEFRCGQPNTPAEKLWQGRVLHVMLTCITLVRQGKIEQRGRGDTKAYRRLV